LVEIVCLYVFIELLCAGSNEVVVCPLTMTDAAGVQTLCPTFAEMTAAIGNVPNIAQNLGQMTAQITNGFAQVNAQLQALALQNTQLTNTVNNMAVNVAKASNASASRDSDGLAPVPNLQGMLPLWFPADVVGFNAMTGQQATNLLQFYNIPFNANQSAPQKRALVKNHVGMRG
jgi:hypothetical protein